MASDLRVPMAPILSAFGVPATVTRPAPDDLPIETVVAWVPAFTEDVPAGSEFIRRLPRKVLAIPRVASQTDAGVAIPAVPTVPNGTRIVAPETIDGEQKSWRVDGRDHEEPDLTRVIVVLELEPI